MKFLVLLGDPPVSQRNAKLVATPVEKIVKLIKEDKKLKESTQRVRAAKDSLEKKKLKSQVLPYVIPFKYSEPVRSQKNFVSASIMAFEADDVPDMESLIKRVKAHPSTFLFYVSVSGDGMKVFVTLDTEVTAKHYIRVYNIIKAQLQADLVVQLDPSNKDMARVQYLSHDPGAIFNPSAKPVAASEILSRLEIIDKAPSERRSKFEAKFSDDEIRAAIKHARENGFLEAKDEKTWWELSMSLASLQEIGREYFMELSSDHPLYPEDTEAALNKRYDQFMRTWGNYHDEERVLNMGSFFNIMEKCYGFKVKKYRGEGNKSLEFILADRFTDEFRGQVLYDHSKAGKARTYGWYIWDGRYFAQSHKGEISDWYLKLIEIEKAKAIAASKDDEKLGGDKDKKKKEQPADENAMTLAMVSRAESRRMRDLTLMWAGEREGLGIVPDDLDSDHDLLCIGNGIMNLRTGKLLPHDPEFRMTKLSPVTYQRGAKCPNWEEFISKISFGNADIARYIQEAVGYTLTGYTSEQCLFFLYGIGANGKSTFLEALRLIFGAYQIHANYETFTALGRDGNSHSEDVVRLKGSRLVISTEVNAHKSLNESIIKSITSGDTITARDLHSSSIEFTPTFKLWISGNHKPRINNFDHGIKRRIFIIPFEYTFTAVDIRPQHEVIQEFEQEAPGILNWALEGTKRWIKNKKLIVPDAVLDTTRQYFLENNLVEQFISENCIVQDKTNKSAVPLTVETKLLYMRYCNFAEYQNEEKLGRNAFYSRLEELGYKRETTTQMKLVFKGITLKEEKSPASKREDIPQS